MRSLMRIVVGALFMQHGAQKLFAVLGRENAADLFSQMGVAGVLEFYGGLLIVLGLLTRPVAFVLAGQMMVAYAIAHVPRGLFPIENGGELALLFAAVFLYFATHGGGSFSADGAFAAWRRRRAAG